VRFSVLQGSDNNLVGLFGKLVSRLTKGACSAPDDDEATDGAGTKLGGVVLSIIDFGDSGYVARYRLDAHNVIILAVRHQKEAGF